MGAEIINILLADDDADDRLFFKEAMEEINADAKVTFVHDGLQLMDYLNRPEAIIPDIIFLDINMPRMNGMACLKEIRNNPVLKDLYVSIYSTSGNENDIQEAFSLGANMYLRKPSNFTDLKSSLANVVNVLFA